MKTEPKPATGKWTELIEEAAYDCSATTQDERKRVISNAINAALAAEQEKAAAWVVELADRYEKKLADQKRDLWEKISLSRIEADNWKGLYEKLLAELGTRKGRKVSKKYQN